MEDEHYNPFQLDSELEAAGHKAEPIPEGMHYVADTRRSSLVTPKCTQGVEDTRCNYRSRGYLPIENYGVIGNLRTVALCGTDGSIDFCCWPKFDSPSIFCRMLDKDKGGHFCITAATHTSNKQQYLPNSNILTTRFLSDDGAGQVTDYMHLPEASQRQSSKPLLPWIIRVVEVIRGTVPFRVECFPAFNYGLDEHTVEIVKREDEHPAPPSLYPEDEVPHYASTEKVVFTSKGMKMDLRWVVKCGEFDCPYFNFKITNPPANGMKGPGVVAEFELNETQEVMFILRQAPDDPPANETPAQYRLRMVKDPALSVSLMEALFRQTAKYWQAWISRSTYKGRWREYVLRSALMLKLLTYEPTGAVVASPTFGLPEAIGGARNWDYRYTWIRDASFTIYAFLRLGLTDEADQYMKFIKERCDDLNEDGSLQIMYSIDGAKKLTETELTHWDGYRGSKPVRIGNGAYDHIQLDIYGELMDGIYLYNKHGTPVSYDMWCAVQKLVNYVCDHWKTADMSIWEVRGMRQNFTYSRVMCWVAVDRGLRLAEKRMFPCPDRYRWQAVRDEIYLDIMQNCWNDERKIFTQSVESQDALDSSVLIMPLVFFCSPCDPRLLSTITQMLLPPEKGGLLANNLVFRYNFLTTDDGLGGIEGAFSMCTFWLVEALTRAGKYDKKLLLRAQVMFEQMISYANHVGLFSEEVARSGELLGNFPQAFTHIAFISAAFNIDRVLSDH